MHALGPVRLFLLVLLVLALAPDSPPGPFRRRLSGLWRLPGLFFPHYGLGAILGLLMAIEAPCLGLRRVYIADSGRFSAVRSDAADLSWAV
jgi:hypothetical protein